jgi:PAS domain S-box-containing protein
MLIELTASDIEMIANAVGCTKRQVRHVLNGERGGRNTVLQQKIRKLAELRRQQNESLQILATDTSDYAQKSLSIDPDVIRSNYQKSKNLLSGYIIDNNQDGFFAFNHRLQYILWNHRMEQITGVPADACIGKTSQDIFDKISHLVDIEKDVFYKNRVLSGEHFCFPAKKYTYPKGEQYWIELHLSPLRDEQDNVIGGVGIMRDVTTYIQTQLELSESITRYEIAEVFMTTTVCKGYMHDVHYVMEWVSPSFTATLGYTLEQFNIASRQNNGWISNEAHILRYKVTEQQLLNNQVVKDFVMLAHRNGKMMPMACYYKPLPAKMQGKAAFLLAISEIQTNKENDWQIRAFFDDAETFFAIIQTKTFKVIHANPSFIRYANNKTVIGNNFMEIHRRYYHRDIKQALFQLNKAFDRAYVILDMGANRAFDSRKLIWLFVQVNPTNIYAVGKMLM